MITCGHRNGSSILSQWQVLDTLFGNGLVTAHLWTTLLTWQFPSIGHSAFFLQLNSGLWSRGFDVIFLLSSLMIFDILFMQLKLTLTVLRLKFLWSLWLLGKCFVTSWRNVFATFVETDLLKFEKHFFWKFTHRMWWGN